MFPYAPFLTGSEDMADVKKVNNANDENLDELHMIRVQKLRDLQAEGNDPFVITKCDVTHHSAILKLILIILTARRFPLPADLCQSVLWVRRHFAMYRI